jgi:flavin reductase (DIM6/NTAB) family NADH-FMN oxidoreductase RutF
MSIAPAALPAATADAFVAAMGAAVTGVSVVTTNGAGGRAGLTVSAMASVSADPPMLLVAINRSSPILALIRLHGSFAVSVLGTHKAALADTFAGRPRSGDAYDFTTARWRTGITGAPLLADAAATFDCFVASTVEAGSHTLVLGDVLQAARGTALPLAYTRRSYAAPMPLLDTTSPDRRPR